MKPTSMPYAVRNSPSANTKKLPAQKGLAKIDTFYIQNSLVIAVSSDARTRACTFKRQNWPLSCY